MTLKDTEKQPTELSDLELQVIQEMLTSVMKLKVFDDKKRAIAYLCSRIGMKL
jgi:hypothetical protein